MARWDFQTVLTKWEDFRYDVASLLVNDAALQRLIVKKINHLADLSLWSPSEILSLVTRNNVSSHLLHFVDDYGWTDLHNYIGNIKPATSEAPTPTSELSPQPTYPSSYDVFGEYCL